jgi:CHAT domain-containing protein
VDRAVGAYLKTMSASRVGYVPKQKALDQEAAELYKLLLQPLEARVAGRQQLYVSPDGNLNLVPFEVLLDAEGKYLIEKVPVSYIAAGRDIVRFEKGELHPGQRADALILADPDYDFGLSAQEKAAAAASFTRGSGLTSFSRLPDTRVEAGAIEQILTQRMHLAVKVFEDDKATEAVLLAAQSPRVLHLATHGYFLDRDEVTQGPDALDQTLLQDDPMFRSGLVLAGVNLSLREGKDEGLLSAQKLMGLRLLGTDLVVLSACETGVGDVLSGEGVFGLKRAFILSGARTVILSLWSVPSEESQQLMTSLYSLMADGKSKAEALREAKLELMKRKPNPFYWAAFILVGSPK